TRHLFEHRHAIFLCRAGIDGRLIDNDVALLQSLADRARGAQQCGEIRSPRLVDRGGYGDDEEVRAVEFTGVRRQDKIGAGKIMRLDLTRALAAGLEFGNPRGIDVETDHPNPFAAERHGDRQPDIPETDDGKLATVRHDFGFDAILCKWGLSYPALGGVR